MWAFLLPWWWSWLQFTIFTILMLPTNMMNWDDFVSDRITFSFTSTLSRWQAGRSHLPEFQVVPARGHDDIMSYNVWFTSTRYIMQLQPWFPIASYERWTPALVQSALRSWRPTTRSLFNYCQSRITLPLSWLTALAIPVTAFQYNLQPWLPCSNDAPIINYLTRPQMCARLTLIQR